MFDIYPINIIAFNYLNIICIIALRCYCVRRYTYKRLFRLANASRIKLPPRHKIETICESSVAGLNKFLKFLLVWSRVQQINSQSEELRRFLNDRRYFLATSFVSELIFVKWRESN